MTLRMWTAYQAAKAAAEHWLSARFPYFAEDQAKAEAITAEFFAAYGAT